MMMQGHEGPPARPWHSRYHHRDDPPPPKPKPKPKVSNSLFLRLSALVLALLSAIVMAVSSECTHGSGVVTFTYTHFHGFVILVGCNITATILEAVALYLQAPLDFAAAAAGPDDKTVATDMNEEEEKAISPAGIVLDVVDELVKALLFSAMAATYTEAADSHDQIGVCAQFAGKVGKAKGLSLAACVAITLAHVAKHVPLPFNVPLVL